MISNDEIRSAKQTNLPLALQNMGVRLVSEGNNFYHHEHDSLKFFKKNGIWLYKWWSRDEVGDGIQYLMNYCGMDFCEAVRLLSNQKFQRIDIEPVSFDDFNRKSRKLIEIAISKLIGPNGEKGYMYLRNKRGFNKDTIKRYRLGWLPEWRQMSSKLVIPCYRSNGDLVRIKFRIDCPDSKAKRYKIMKGSDTSIPFTSGINLHKPVVIVESELDAILIDQEAGSEIGVLALGGVGNRLNHNVVSYLNEKIQVKLISLDNDNPGIKRSESLRKVLSNAYDWPVPIKYGKDPGEAWMHMSIKNWILKGLNLFKRN